ncbi:helix-turn-helix transcriptional regulator [Salinimicrobium sp. GXAS 041]|uniref:helix-turn-helix transcriptional regulator n=1 Tax=Salinimicrobium sp. GXAS 041 TaxID=3400806 RepID=UPI003C75D6A2
MHSKTNQTNQIPQFLIAGTDLTNPNDIEFWGIKKNQTVFFLQAGHVYKFEELAPKFYVLLLNKLNSDKGALQYFSQFDIPTKRKVELYTYYLYGMQDHTPDIINGELQPCENFRDTTFCPSLAFDHKDVKLNGATLKKRDIVIIEMSANGDTDEAIAQALGIKLPTLDCHKKSLFVKTGTTCKLDLVSKSYKQHIIA